MSASTEKKLRQAARKAGTDKKTLAAQEAEKKKRKSNIKWTVSTVAVVLVIALVLFLNTSFLYTHTTALTVNDEEFTPAEVSYYYSGQFSRLVNQYGDYSIMFGLDPRMGLVGLDSQPCPMLSEEGGSWKDYFSDMAENEILQTRAILKYAADNGITLTDEEAAEITGSLDGMEEAVKLQGFGSLNKFFAANYGRGVDSDVVVKAGMDTALAAKAVQSVSSALEYSDKELEDYYKSLNGESDVVNYAYYTVAAEAVESTDADGKAVKEANDDTRAAAKASADAIVKAYKDGKEADFAEKLDAAVSSEFEEASSTRRSNAPAGSLGDYKEWLMGSRHEGDITVIETKEGNAQHVVVFLGRSDNHYPMAQVRHILVRAVPAEDGSFTEEAKAEAKAKAEDILKEFNSGDKTEESFAELASKYSEDPGSNTNGGLYDTIAKGQMIEEFDRFCFEGHKAGNTGIVYGESGGVPGYHIMYYVGEGDLYSNFIAKNGLMNRDMENWLSEITEGFESKRGYAFRFVG